MKKKLEEDDEQQFDSKLKKVIFISNSQLEDNFQGKGSSTSSARIMKEYKQLLRSKEFPPLDIQFKNETNFYTWTIDIDIMKFELSTELKEDFEQLVSKHKQVRRNV